MKIRQLILIVSVVKILIWKPNSFLIFLLFIYIDYIRWVYTMHILYLF